MPRIDYDSLEIVPRERKPLSEKKYAAWKEMRFLKEVVIVRLKYRLDWNKRTLAKLRKQIKDMKYAEANKPKPRTNRVVKLAVQRVIYRRKALFKQRFKKVDMNKVKKSADVLLNQHVKMSQLYNSSFIDGVSAFSIIMLWCRTQKFNPDIMATFILMNHYEWIMFNDAKFFGIMRDKWTRHTIALARIGLIERIKKVPATYIVTQKGKTFFQEYQDYYKERIQVMLTEYDKNYGSKKGYAPTKIPVTKVKVPRKYKIPRKETNKDDQ